MVEVFPFGEFNVEDLAILSNQTSKMDKVITYLKQHYFHSTTALDVYGRDPVSLFFTIIFFRYYQRHDLFLLVFILD